MLSLGVGARYVIKHLTTYYTVTSYNILNQSIVVNSILLKKAKTRVLYFAFIYLLNIKNYLVIFPIVLGHIQLSATPTILRML